MKKKYKNKLRKAVASQSQLDPIDAIASDIDIYITNSHQVIKMHQIIENHIKHQNHHKLK